MLRKVEDVGGVSDSASAVVLEPSDFIVIAIENSVEELVRGVVLNAFQAGVLVICPSCRV